MNIKATLVFLVVIAAGVLGGAAAYQVAVPTGKAEPAARDALVVKPGGKLRDQRPAGFAPCKAPAKLEDGKCVTDVVRTVVLPGTSASSAGRTPVAPPPAPIQSFAHDDEGRHHGGEGEEGHHGDDDDDDDHDDYDDDTDDSHHGGDEDSRDTGTHTNTNTNTGTH